MYKLICNGMVVDILKEICYVRYLPKQGKLTITDRQSANGVMGSDKNTVYHLIGTPYTFADEVETVDVYEIDKDEFDKLHAEKAFQAQRQSSLEAKVSRLEAQMERQNMLLEKLINSL